MVSYIPVDLYVTVNPSVIGAGSSDLGINGLFIGKNNLIPAGQVTEFNSADAVSDWFGSDAYETTLANVYFNGFTNCTKFPSALYFVPYITAARAAWARGSSLKGMTLATLKTITGGLAVTIGGTEYKTEAINLSAVTSFTDAATALTSDLGLSSAGTVTWDALSSRFTITSTATGAEATITQVTGTAAKSLGLASAVLSQGAAVNTLTDILNFAKKQNLNWALFSTVEQPEQDENTEMAIWANNQNKGWGFIMSDNDPNAEIANNETCFGFLARDMKYEGVAAVYDANENPTLKAFVLGMCASVDWNALNGRVDAAYRRQSGLAPTCRDGQTAQNILDNGYSYYGAVGGRGKDNTYNFFYNGNMPGSYSRLGKFINQVWLNNKIKLTVIDLMLALNSFPYNDEGYTRLRNAISGDDGPVDAGLNNGVIRRGISLSGSQKEQIIAKVGFDISNELYSQGWYLQIVDAPANVRAQGGSPSINFFYCDGSSIEQITIASIMIE
ncbi:DUF3383 family protein [Oxalobacter paraformigenes]|uniref:DUF3383 domain-containing protein n=1 Tax=Oxalobacter paraformigenes TaxID=556268 RepID=C3X1U3_9BURK|nr:DUF3383 family protein [Oxalobacter paraformigenes]EEO27179.1 hypothetical protein OFAG_00332 [Oxalobacter paraformigenes]